MNAPQQPHPAPSFGRYIGGTIFFSRWLQAPLYLGLIVAQIVYVAHFGKELKHLIVDFGHLTEAQIMLIVLGLVDVVMIGTEADEADTRGVNLLSGLRLQFGNPLAPNPAVSASTTRTSREGSSSVR